MLAEKGFCEGLSDTCPMTASAPRTAWQVSGKPQGRKLRAVWAGRCGVFGLWGFGESRVAVGRCRHGFFCQVRPAVRRATQNLSGLASLRAVGVGRSFEFTQALSKVVLWPAAQAGIHGAYRNGDCHGLTSWCGGGARGQAPRSKVSMMIMAPPQHGQGCASCTKPGG